MRRSTRSARWHHARRRHIRQYHGREINSVLRISVIGDNYRRFSGETHVFRRTSTCSPIIELDNVRSVWQLAGPGESQPCAIEVVRRISRELSHRRTTVVFVWPSGCSSASLALCRATFASLDDGVSNSLSATGNKVRVHLPKSSSAGDIESNCSDGVFRHSNSGSLFDSRALIISRLIVYRHSQLGRWKPGISVNS